MKPASGCVMNIQRFCTEDGPGIRTTVFLKGCNLRCAWCHNPESWSFAPEIVVSDQCVGCGTCVRSCTTGHLSMVQGQLKVRPLCPPEDTSFLHVCPQGALSVIGKYFEPEALLKVLAADQVFYRVSGGGVTFSGGEPMLSIDFLEKMLTLCHEKGIHTAVDTAGCVPWTSFERIIPVTDLFLFDVKALTPEIHKEYVGKSNELILRNLSQLLHSNQEMTLCVPVIPGINDGEELHKILGWMKDQGAERPGVTVKLIPYHTLGEEKYIHRAEKRRLGKITPYTDEQIDAMETLLPQYGLKKSIF